MNTHNPNHVGIQSVQLGGSFSEIAAEKFFAGREVLLQPFTDHAMVVDAFRKRLVPEIFIPVRNSTYGHVLAWVEAFGSSGLGTRAFISGVQTIKVQQCLLAYEGMGEDELQAVASQIPALSQVSRYITRRGLVEFAENDTLGAALKIKESKGIIDGLRTAAVASKLAGVTAGLVNLGVINDEPTNATRFWHIVHSDGHNASGRNLALTLNVPEAKMGLLGAMRVLKDLGYIEIDIDSHLRSNSKDRHSFYGEFIRPHETADPKALILALKKSGIKSKILGLYTPKDDRGDITRRITPRAEPMIGQQDISGLCVEEGATVLYINANSLVDILECLKVASIFDMCRPKAPTGSDFASGYYVSLVGIPQSLINNALKRLDDQQLETMHFVIKNGVLAR